MLIRPETPEQLAEALRAAGSEGPVHLGGAFTKKAMGGPVCPGVNTISTAALAHVLRYEPRDLTISVEAGVPFCELSRLLAEHRQMLPLDPPFAACATVGGVVAANCSGPRRRLYGTARDFIIGMKLATPAGRLVQSGGMVVKNVAGLDMAKLMIGSFGTLAAIAVVNFKLVPVPPASRTFVFSFDSLRDAVDLRNRVVNSVLQPAALDLLNPAAAADLGLSGFLLVIQAQGTAAVLDRYSRELARASVLEGREEAALWDRIREFTPEFLAGRPDAAVVRVSGTVTQVRSIVESMDQPALARAGTGVCYGYFSETAQALEWMQKTADCGWKSVIESAPVDKKPGLDLWPEPGGDLDLMRRIKQWFDPGSVLNPGRLYGRI